VYNSLLAENYRPDDIVVIHDGVRPFLSHDRLTACITQARSSGACIMGIPVVDTLKRVDKNGDVEYTVQRAAIWQAQTPQAFVYHLLKSAHDDARRTGASATDDALLVERLGEKVKVIPGSLNNLKITTEEDLALAEAICRIP
jgi:2-C-methyl-D-erythritol 4-phosphate cytidylyltransferase